MEVALWLALFAVILSGVAGWVIQAFVPAAMTDRFGTEERPYEQIPHLCDLLRKKAVEKLEAARANAAVPPSGKEELKRLRFHADMFLRHDWISDQGRRAPALQDKAARASLSEKLSEAYWAAWTNACAR